MLSAERIKPRLYALTLHDRFMCGSKLTKARSTWKPFRTKKVGRAVRVDPKKVDFRYNPLESGEMAEWLKAAVC
jgi:hypothetical protein